MTKVIWFADYDINGMLLPPWIGTAQIDVSYIPGKKRPSRFYKKRRTRSMKGK